MVAICCCIKRKRQGSKGDPEGGQVLKMESSKGRIPIPISEFHNQQSRGEIPKQNEFEELVKEDAQRNKSRSQDIALGFKTDNNDTQGGMNRYVFSWKTSCKW